MTKRRFPWAKLPKADPTAVIGSAVQSRPVASRSAQMWVCFLDWRKEFPEPISDNNADKETVDTAAAVIEGFATINPLDLEYLKNIGEHHKERIRNVLLWANNVQSIMNINLHTHTKTFQSLFRYNIIQLFQHWERVGSALPKDDSSDEETDKSISQSDILDQNESLAYKETEDLGYAQVQQSDINVISSKNIIRNALRSTKISEAAIEAAVSAALAVEFSYAASNSELPTVLPTKATRNGRTFFEAPNREPIPLYGERADKSMDAIAFYERYWRPYVRAGLLYRNHLTQFNNSLVSSIRQQCKRDNLDPDRLLPPTKTGSIEEEITASGLSENDIKRLARYIDRKRARERTDPDRTPE